MSNAHTHSGTIAIRPPISGPSSLILLESIPGELTGTAIQTNCNKWTSSVAMSNRTGNLPHRHDPLTHYFLSRYSPGTSSSGTSCVWTSPSSASPASSTPFTTSASNEFPSSRSSSTLSEFARPALERPCRSPDWPPERAPSPAGSNVTVSTSSLFPRTRPLGAVAVLARATFLERGLARDCLTATFLAAGFACTAAFFGVAFLGAGFFASFFLAVTFFLLWFFLFFFLVAIRG